jgi:dihydroflavonol-4-reductase
MRVAVTGATGLLGSNLAVEMAARGHEVVATKRGKSRIDHLARVPIRWVEAGLDDVNALAKAFEGAGAVFHCAAAVTIQFRVTPEILAANVDGTRHVIEAVRRSGVGRLVHCSTVGAVGLSIDGQPSSETARWNMPEFGLGDAYVSTKRQAQDLVLEAVKAGVDAVVVNPTYMIGPYDVRPSSGTLVRDLVRGKVPAYTLGKNNFVDVRDVARGMAISLDKGKRGELYILGGHNLTYKDFFEVVARVTGTRAPRRRAPRWLVRTLGWWGDLVFALTGKEPALTTGPALWSLTDRFIFSSAKAERELGYTISPLEPAIEACVTWFKENGMLP